jgi:hypothetical protein
MPPTFAYIMCLILWMAAACLVWLAAGLMSLTTSTRALAKRLFFAMARTFPFVFAYQIIAAPFVAASLLMAWAFWKILEPGASSTNQNPFVIVVSIGVALLSLVAMFVASVAGFYEGWRIGWAYGNGRALQEVLYEGPTLKPIWLLLRTGFNRGRALVRRGLSHIW